MELSKIAFGICCTHPYVIDQAREVMEYEDAMVALALLSELPITDVRRRFRRWVWTQPGSWRDCYASIRAGDREWVAETT